MGPTEGRDSNTEHDNEPTPDQLQTNHSSNGCGDESAHQTRHETLNVHSDEHSGDRSSASRNDGKEGTNGEMEEDDTQRTEQPLSVDSTDDEVPINVSNS